MFTADSIYSVADNMTQDESVPAAPLPVRRRCDAILPKVTLLFIEIALVLAGVYFLPNVTTPLIRPRSPATNLAAWRR